MNITPTNELKPILDEVKKRIHKNHTIENYENILMPVLSITQSLEAYDIIEKFMMMSNHDEYTYYGYWGQGNKMYCININNTFYIFTIISNLKQQSILDDSYEIGHIFKLDNNYLTTLRMD
jgi:hypothetical protein